MTERDPGPSPAAAPELDRTFWEQRWAAHSADTGEAEPNPTLAGTASQLSPGVALDAGSGIGADAIWLARRGWTVDAVDFVASALDSAHRRAERLGPGVASRIAWRQGDLNTWTPTRHAYDLVSAHYLHGVSRRADLFRRLAAAVRPGGTLLIVGHHPSNLDVSGDTMSRAVFFTAAEVLEVLDEAWESVTADDAVPRQATDHDGHPIMLRSVLVQAQRRIP